MHRRIILFFCLVQGILGAQAQTIPLYESGKIPFAKDNGEIPTLTIFKPEHQRKNATAIIICSGGSYGGRANSVEGIPAAEKLTAAGFVAFLLDYRVPNSTKMDHKEIVPLTDAQRAIQYVREHASEYKIDKNKVGIMGFSAGGHLISTVVTHFDTTTLENPLQTSLRPDFAVLVYPVISFADSLTHERSRDNLIGPDISAENVYRYSNELQVTDKTPPCFIVHAVDDDVVKVENALYFDAALRQHHVPQELFIYTKGGHGFGVHNQTVTVQWIDACIQWIRKINK